MLIKHSMMAREDGDLGDGGSPAPTEADVADAVNDSVDSEAGEDVSSPEPVAVEAEIADEPAETVQDAPGLYDRLQSSGVDLSSVIGEYRPKDDAELIQLLGNQVGVISSGRTQLSEFEKNRQQYEQWLESRNTPPQAVEPAPEKKGSSFWNPPEVDPGVMEFVEVDRETGLYKAKMPGYEQAAVDANRLLQYKQQKANEFMDDPVSFTEKAVAGYVEDRIAEALSAYQPIAQERVEKQLQSAITPFESQLVDAAGNETAAYRPFMYAYQESAAYSGMSLQDRVNFAAMKAGLSMTPPQSAAAQTETPATPQQSRPTNEELKKQAVSGNRVASSIAEQKGRDDSGLSEGGKMYSSAKLTNDFRAEMQKLAESAAS